MKITFCGAAQEVTGSCHLITLDSGFKILLDCGLYQGWDDEMEDFNENWNFSPDDIDILILSHAHIDHSGRIPKLVKDGYKGSIHATHATFSLCSIMLLDSAMIQERDAEYHNRREKRKKGKKAKLKKPLYTREDASVSMNQFVGHGYNRWHRVNEELEFIYRDAGHILGSASVILRIHENGETKTLAFTGDVGRPDRPILRDPVILPPVDYIITESTYGDKLHDEKPYEVERFLRILRHTCLEKRGKLLIPAFSVGRTQELVYMMDRLETLGELPHIPVYVDSPLSVNATQIFGGHPECYDDALHEYMLLDKNPFGFNGLNYITKVEDSKKLNKAKDPCVIISSSGMMNAGRIRHHLYNNIEDPKNTLLIVGFCAPHTTGGVLRAGAEEITLFGESLQVRCDIEIMDSFSAHADQMELKNFLLPQKDSVQEIILVHGELDRQKVFKDVLEDSGFKNIHIPSLFSSIGL